MKFQEFASVFDTDPAELALLSTFNFDTDFFERRLLRSRSLAKARRIIVFIDHGQWHKLLRLDAPARWLNQRYLVVPVSRPHGVFHPKLHLLVSEKGCRISCGSGNLTRSGSTQNLELLNSLSFDLDDEGKSELHSLARSALRLFSKASSATEGEAGEISLNWIEELKKNFQWLAKPDDGQSELGIRPLDLVHTYDGSLWDRLLVLLADDPPTRFVVISPYYDPNADMIRRVFRQWPKCQLEIVAQQGTSNLPIDAIGRLESKPTLFEIRNSSRRLHGKMVAWQNRKGMGCLAGSANFTSAAFDSRNVEACVYVADAEAAVAALFDAEISKKKISISKFTPGTEDEPEAEPDPAVLRLESAVLYDGNKIRIRYSHSLNPPPSELIITLRTPGERDPKTTKRITVKAKGTAEASFPENTLTGISGSLFATLVAATLEGKIESAPAWVIQEDCLTHEQSEGSGGGSHGKIKDSGEGLPEFLDELGERGGVSAIVEYLTHLNIRFFDGNGRTAGGKNFRLRRSDPFHPDVSPEWWIKGITQAEDLEQAIYDFVARHEKSRLRKHAERGNINGIENFLDIFTAIIRLMYVYYRRKRNPNKKSESVTYVIDVPTTSDDGVVKRPRLISQICNCVLIATSGIELTDDVSEGYLDTLTHNFWDDRTILWEVCEEVNFAGNIKAGLLIAQMARFVPNEQTSYGPPATRASECLRKWERPMLESFDYAQLDHPSNKNVMDALEQYHMFSDDELLQYEKELN